MEQDRAPAVLAHLDERRARPLESHEGIVNTIAATNTRSGLTVHAELDTRDCPNGIKITEQQMETLERRVSRRPRCELDGRRGVPRTCRVLG